MRKYKDHVTKYYKQYILCTVIYMLVLAMLIGGTPKSFEKSFAGVEYRLGDSEFVEKTVMSFEGNFTDPPIGYRNFKGTLTYGEDILTTDIDFDKNGKGHLVGYKESGSHENLGQIYINDEFDSITVTLYKYNEKYIKHWSSEDGAMFSSPASSREEGINLGNIHLAYSGLSPLQ